MTCSCTPGQAGGDCVIEWTCDHGRTWSKNPGPLSDWVEVCISDCITSKIHNPATGRPDLYIIQADTHILISVEVVDAAFNDPNPLIFGIVEAKTHDLFVVLNGRNKQVRYKLIRQDHTALGNPYQAELVEEWPPTTTGEETDNESRD